MKKVVQLFTFLFLGTAVYAQSQNEIEGVTNQGLEFKVGSEFGFLSVLSHKVQFDQDGTYFDYAKDGGQDVLFPFKRFTAEISKNRNTFVLLYQPLKLESTVTLNNDLEVNDLVFPAGSAVNLLYGFPFYRVSYMRELIKKDSKNSFEIGASLQIRNATISFESTDGSLYRTNRDVGPVPAFKMRGRRYFSETFFGEFEVDGMYAPISYLNGSDNEITGAIVDASLRTGFEINRNFETFFNVRYLAGGAVGSSDSDDGPGDGYTRNWLHFGTVSAGISYSFNSK